MSIPSKSLSKPKQSIPSWRNSARAKIASPPSLTYVIAEPEHRCDYDSHSHNPVSTLRRSQMKSLTGASSRPGSSSSVASPRRAAPPPALVSMVVRSPENMAVTTVSVNGLLDIPTSAKGKEKEKVAEDPMTEKLLEIPYSDSFPATTPSDDPIPPNCIPSTSASATDIPSSDFRHDSSASVPLVDTDPAGSDTPTNTFAEASPSSKVPAASSKKEGSSWFATSWLSWSSSAPNHSNANASLHGGSHVVNDHGDLTDEQRPGKTRDRDGGDIDSKSPGQQVNIIRPLMARERSREDEQNQPSQPSHFPVVVADGGVSADKPSVSITHDGKTTSADGNPTHDGKTTSADGNPLTDVVRQNPAPTRTTPIQISSHAVDVSATTTPPDARATAVSAPLASVTPDLRTSPSGSTDAAGGTIAQDSTSSWWDYIGWKNTTAVKASASAPSSEGAGEPTLGLQGKKSEDVSKDGANVSIAPDLESVDPKLASASVPSDEGALQAHTDSEQAQKQSQPDQAQAQQPPQPEQEQAQVRESTKSQHTRNAAASSWYNPWSWHGSSSHLPVVGKHDPSEAPVNGESEKNETVEEQPAESTEGTEAPQAPQLQAPQVSVSPPEEEQSQPPIDPAGSNVLEEQNPISATIDSHRSSWLSFFASTSSRALITKTITAPQAPDATSAGGSVSNNNNNVKVDENGMEVMDIDEEAESPASQVSQAQPPSPDSPKAKEEVKDKDSKAIATVSPLSPAQGLVATLVRGRGRVRSIPARVDMDKESLKDGLNSDASSVRSGMGGQVSGTATPINGTPIPSKPGATESSASGAGSVPSSPASTTVSLVKRASLSLTAKNSTATAANGNTTTANGTATSTTVSTNVATPTAAPGNGKNSKNNKSKSVSPTPSPTSKKPAPTPPLPNFVLPSWQETFYSNPRSTVPRRDQTGTLTKTFQYVSGWLLSGGRAGGASLIGRSSGWRGREAGKVADKSKRKASSAERQTDRELEFMHFGMALPKAWDILNPPPPQGEVTDLKEDVLRGSKKVVVIGVHGWFPGAVMRTVIGEPTGTSTKLANMMSQALNQFEVEQGVQFEKVTKIPLEGEGTVKHRVEKLYSNLLGNKEWMDDLRDADAILVATHSQGSVVSTHLLDRLIADKHIRTAQNSFVTGPASSFPSAAGMDTAPSPKVQRICCLAMCGIHLGPLRYLSTSSLFQPYIQYLESAAARELFEFQNTNSEASKEYVKALRSILSNGVKMLYAASLNDQVVPIYSGLFTVASHPLILRALYIDGDAYNSSDFLANLLVLLLRILNSGISDSGLLVHLSEATAGSLNGVGHSTPYEETAIFSLAVKYLFLTNDGLEEHPELVLDPFNARQEQNDYEIPWALRDVIADERVRHYFSKEIVQLRDAFREWHPRTSILRDLKRKLQPIQRLPASFATSRL